VAQAVTCALDSSPKRHARVSFKLDSVFRSAGLLPLHVVFELATPLYFYNFPFYFCADGNSSMETRASFVALR